MTVGRNGAKLVERPLTLERMLYMAFNSNHQMLLAQKAKELVGQSSDSRFPIRLVCVDSLTAHFRAEYVGRGTLASRQQKLNKHLHDLMRINDLYNVATLVIQQEEMQDHQTVVQAHGFLHKV